ncbi:hypothetical protein LG634_09905 [Streptomyces bambusae]|uniref:hypothetical protein n=1 Tax=Streptomyces bambusae TaxID=1550616 RepID=UPI001CFD2AC4|nr:hypothetical protein [Streptomyces bambusae]MCB5165139.1 hypothetical protein [Streptomyces bambusae]
MPRYQFSLYEINIRRVRDKESLQAAKYGAQRKDLLDSYNRFLDEELKGAGKRIDKGERYLRLKDSEVDFRTLWFTVEAGRYGVPGKIVETDTGADAYEINVDDAASYPLRQALIVPSVGNYALWATESVGHASAFGGLSISFRDWFRRKHDSEKLITEINHFQDTNAWNEFIDKASLNEITYVVHEQDSDGSVGSRIQEHKVRAVRRSRLPSPWIKQALEKKLPADTVFSAKQLPEADEIRMQIETDGRQRTIVVGRSLPRFMYEIADERGPAPTDETFRSAVMSEVGASLEYMHVDPRTWQG